MSLFQGLCRRLAAAVCIVATTLPAWGQDGRQGRLVDVAWLQRHAAEVLLLDASFTSHHRAGHIAGAVSADLYRYGPNEVSRAAMEQRLQSWGVSPGRKIVVYDRGADMMAPRLFYDLYYNGVPADDLFILDGGLTRWRAQGGAVVQDTTSPPTPGSFRIGNTREEVRVRLPEFLVASGDPARHALVEALELNYHYGTQKFFDRAGHVPNAMPMPSEDFFNADKTFKSPEEIARMARHLGIRQDQVVHSHCGGGVAAAVPWFALQFIVGHPQVKLYLESQREWLRDERGLPYWTYGAPQLQRSSGWLDGWNAPMLRAFGVAKLAVIDVRAPARYAEGHVPAALNIPAETLRRQLRQPEQLATLLAQAGVDPAHDLVIVDEPGLSRDAALAFLALESLGHRKVAVLAESMDEWALRGHVLTKDVPPAAAAKTGWPVANAAVPRRNAVLVDPTASRGEYPKVFVAAGQAAPARKPEGTWVHLPHTALLNANGTPKTAQDLWPLIHKAGVPRHAEVVFYADDPGDAAINYYVFRLMGWPDVKVWVY